MNVVVLSRDLIIASRIVEAAARGGHTVQRVDEPGGLPAATSVDLLFVNWAEREPTWAESLTVWLSADPARRPLILFGPHTDLEAHAAARASGLGPMLARSKLVSSLSELMPSANA